MRVIQARTPDQALDVELSLTQLRMTRLQAALELAFMVLVVGLIEWLVPLMGNSATAYGVLALAIALLMAVCFLKDGLGPRQLGIRLDNFIPALADLLPFLMVFVLGLISIGLVSGSLRLGDRFWSMLAVVP